MTARVPAELAEWASAYAKERGVTRQALIEEAVRSLREDASGGVPVIRQRAREVVEQGSGDCPKSAAGHVWASASVDPRRRCVHCKLPGRGDDAKGEAGNLAAAGAARAAFFQMLKAPMQNGTGDPEKAKR